MLCRPSGRDPAGHPWAPTCANLKAAKEGREGPGASQSPTAVAARAGRSGDPVNHLPYLLPWLRVALLIRSILFTRFDEAVLPTAKTTLARALMMRSRLSREGWWN
jgi:hypothetical protein